MSRTPSTLSELARIGFTELTAARDQLEGFPPRLHEMFRVAADPDRALRMLLRLSERAPEQVESLIADDTTAERLIRVLGASSGIGEFFARRPDQLDVLRASSAPRDQAGYTDDLLGAIDGLHEEAAWVALRVRYRRHLAAIAAWDLSHPDPVEAVSTVAAGLADLAGAALEASLVCARRDLAVPSVQLDATRLAVIAMGKCGARELNYLSDVDVIFVAEAGEGVSTELAVTVATRLAKQVIRGISELAIEPALWEIDTALRPEGKDGALVRTLDSHLAYYERWAKSWEFQALLKARAIAGDRELGTRYEQAVAPLVWASSSRDGFVDSVQEMRVRVTEHIPADQVDVQLKLGPGGLRDIEFTIQLLQLVHGRTDAAVRRRSTLDALEALADGGYIGRAESAEFAREYRLLRLLEHRLQLDRLHRTHLMPREEAAARVLARATGLFTTADGVMAAWEQTKRAVRSLHERLFYRPLLSAVAALPEGGISLSTDQAKDRLSAIGFRDPEGALQHMAALTAGMSRKANVQRTLLPVMLQWFAEGADPDLGLQAFRRLSDALGDAYWFLRLLRDSSGAAQRLTRVLSGSRYVVGLIERLPEAVAWLDRREELRPRPAAELMAEVAATVSRHETADAAARALRTLRRREVLRLALGSMVGEVSVIELGRALSEVVTAFLSGLVALARPDDDGIEFGLIAMGRYGGRELGFGSDADVMAVYRADAGRDEAQRIAEGIVRRVRELSEDLLLPFELDFDLRPEGRTGPLTRSLESYRAYYDRWSLTWEAQALLRARGAVGDVALLRDFDAMADRVRYPVTIDEQSVREVKRIKARVESERLPQGADPARHVKLGRGSLSDVEWCVQLLQLQHGHAIDGLQTTSTLGALDAAVSAGLMTEADVELLRAGWLIASRTRSAMTLWNVRTTDVLPADRTQLEGIARLMGYPRGGAADLENDYLATTRRARHVFERLFYGEE